MKREPVFDVLTWTVRGLLKAQGLDITIDGTDRIPASGGAVLAVNHTSYVDFMEVGLVARKAGRYPRYMMKAELRENKVVGFLMNHCQAIGVDRSHGSESYHEAVDSLRAGNVVVVYPEATISRSFELKEFKTGAARMALDADVPIVPIAIWGVQRVWTKDMPKKLGRSGYPVRIVVGEPVPAEGDVDTLTGRIRESLQNALDRAQAEYPMKQGARWVPRRLGGSAPTLEEARVLEEKELEARRAKKARQAGG
ncbi:lysophospholipid acyltransferase family protein [Tsukamurella sp. 8F]|uniref:lysophospholipid acyltransferase family protein n=1 Tax=unclassified Tsukamurella TaxID=2633480 RepID=UPI0023B8F38F|nr:MULTISPECIES: lysophospholipid acyltransferase family protein [unclassified Tsukamurella]MDF0530290.1 lysophospholipid acyltransferase family protein [Tsukamurella sp. 8J]MDF0588608.1 lysophospholipid acyltransferase family protein [Tsukamurella sp. 8F]